MTADVVVHVENVSKKFSRHLRHVIKYGLSDIARNMVGLSSQHGVLRDGEFWAIDNVSFGLKRGEVLGIIGVNGSGKSTLLKMLNGIFMPDKGRIEIEGRVGALIEVGAGFHPMLTGRENIYINGAIMGMGKKEIDRKFDEIIEFADIGDFIDAPLKHYSSGMFVRLGFAVAINSVPDILLVDEILAVGDIGFQRKCFEKIKGLKKKGASVILVSHNMYSVEGFCDTALVLNNGNVISYSDDIANAVAFYEKTVLRKNAESLSNEQAIKKTSFKNRGTGEIEITSVKLIDQNGRESREFSVGEEILFEVEFDSSVEVGRPVYSFALVRIDGLVCGVNRTYFDKIVPPRIEKGKSKFGFSIINQLNSGEYFIGIAISERELAGQLPYCWRQMETFTVVDAPAPNVDDGCGVFFPQVSWKP